MEGPAGALAEIVRSGRLARQLSQEELARLAGVGTSSLRLIEAGKANGPSLYTTLRLLRVLGIDEDALRAVSDEM